MMREPFEMPDDVVTDIETGYALNMPLGPQDYPGWQLDRPEVIQRLMRLREEAGIVISDDMFVERQKRSNVQTGKTGRRAARLPKKVRS